MQKYLTGGQDVTECPLAGDEFQKLFKASLFSLCGPRFNWFSVLDQLASLL